MSTTVTLPMMSASGSDSIVVDNRRDAVPSKPGPGPAKTVRRRRAWLGAGSLVFIEDDREVDFSSCFFNTDGSVARMCGNGALGRRDSIGSPSLGLETGHRRLPQDSLG